ncbi:MAG: transporter [Hyphomicrobiales bacterium]|nr:transporter [Hyphomicrobiales bacterium]
MFSRFAAICAAAACLLATLVASTAHEGHDHAPGPSVATTANTSTPRTEAASSAFEVVAVLVGDELRIWVDTFETNEPITGATVEVETPAGPASAAATADGAYAVPAPWAKAQGRHELTFTIVDGGNVDVLTAAIDVPAPAEARPLKTEGAAATALGSGNVLAAAGVAGLLLGAATAGALRRRPLIWAPALGLAMLAMFGAARLFAHEGHDHGEQATAIQVTADRAQILADGSVLLPKPNQRVLAVRTELGAVAQHAKRIELPGRIISDPNHSGLVQTAAPGRLSPPEGGFPSLGASVRAGDVLAFVATPFQAIDQSTMRQQQGDLDQQISIAERRLARYETLLKTGAVSQVLLEETRLRIAGITRPPARTRQFEEPAGGLAVAGRWRDCRIECSRRANRRHERCRVPHHRSEAPFRRSSVA